MEFRSSILILNCCYFISRKSVFRLRKMKFKVDEDQFIEIPTRLTQRVSHICCNLATVEQFVNSIEVGRFRKQFKALLVKKYYERKTAILPYPKTSSWDNFLGIPLSEMIDHQSNCHGYKWKSSLKNILVLNGHKDLWNLD
ncbi:hypothetical protein KUTeg_005700 [Tegillarca granosa]|uniref:Uncharacterized protein n=1 Tax=Tegillarca granosa TaxID=220873 RepID=A0ABQ9FHK5_TEGGR|nr:hypothetical protein KUTeg_005700 [Tegillarca granosa]